jgi:hypothetical protein
MRPFASLCTILFAATALPLAAQQVCFDQNPNPPIPTALPALPSGWYAYRVDAPQFMVVSAIEFFGRVVTTGAVRSTPVQIWDQDPVTFGPGAVIGTGTLSFQGDWAYYRAPLTNPVVMLPSGVYFVGMQIQATATGNGFTQVARSSSTSGVTATTYHVDRGAGWSSAVINLGFSFRLHCGTHSYGTGITGTSGRIASMAGLGFPNLGNQIAYQVWNVLPSSPAGVLIGLRNATPSPVGTLWVDPSLVAISGTSGIRGSFSVPLDIPVNLGLVGIPLAGQGFVVDAGGPFSLPIVLSDGLEMTIGN